MKNGRADSKITVLIPAFVAAFAFSLASCTQFSLSDVFGSPALAINPQSLVVGTGSVVNFTGTGGTPPYSFLITVSAGGSLEQSTGRYSAPGDPGSETVTVTDARGKTSSAVVTVVSASGTDVTISPISVSVTRGTSITFTASGGIGPYTFGIASGDGFFADPFSGVGSALYWASTVNDTGSALVTVTDSAATPAEATANVFIGPLPVPVSISPVDRIVMVGSEIDFDYAGGAPPYAFSVNTDRFASVDPASGAYTASRTAGTDTVVVTDGLGLTAASEVKVYAAPPLVISPPAVRINAESAYVFAVSGGAGGSVLTAGAGSVDQSGNYTAPAGAGSDTVTVTDKVGASVSATVTYVGTGTPLVLSPSAADVPEGGALLLVGSGGTAPLAYGFAASDGSVTQDGYTALFSAVGAPVGVTPVTITLTNGTDPDAAASLTVIPGAPTNLTATINPANKKEVFLAWQDNSAAEDAYYIDVKIGETGAFAPAASTGAGAVSYTYTGLPNNAYGFRVRAGTGALRSYYSNDAYAITK